MRINLKQPEIITALKQYVQTQGINLVGKAVEVSFTAGRAGTGVSVEISIEDQEPSATGLIHLKNSQINATLPSEVGVTESVLIQTTPAQSDAPASAFKTTTSLFG